MVEVEELLWQKVLIFESQHLWLFLEEVADIMQFHMQDRMLLLLKQVEICQVELLLLAVKAVQHEIIQEEADFWRMVYNQVPIDSDMLLEIEHNDDYEVDAERQVLEVFEDEDDLVLPEAVDIQVEVVPKIVNVHLHIVIEQVEDPII